MTMMSMMYSPINIVTLALFFQYKGELMKNFSSLALPLFENGTFRPIIHTVLPLGNIRQAHELMESNVNTGKIILKVEDTGSKQEL